jgi:hypothetical protein
MKYPHYQDYPRDSTELSERVLLTAWPALSNYHSELVLVGGLVPRYLCRPQALSLPAVTMDVDLGIALGASAGQYGSLSSHLQGLGFKRVDERFVKRVGERTDIYLDFLTEVPGKSKGTVMVDDMPTSVFRGIDRALATNRVCEILGTDLYGAKQNCQVRVCEVGPYLVLKLIAFGARAQPKDAFDLHQMALLYDGGAAAAIAAFAAEKSVNSGFNAARAALAEHFMAIDRSGPLRGATFVFGDNAAEAAAEESLRFRQELVNFGQALLEVS